MKAKFNIFNICRKKKLISPNELELPWQPLYKISLHMMETGENRPEMYYFSSVHKVAIKALIVCAKVYFPVSKYFSLNKLMKDLKLIVYDS